jgi:hypothetical protein
MEWDENEAEENFEYGKAARSWALIAVVIRRNFLQTVDKLPGA